MQHALALQAVAFDGTVMLLCQDLDLERGTLGPRGDDGLVTVDQLPVEHGNLFGQGPRIGL